MEEKENEAGDFCQRRCLPSGRGTDENTGRKNIGGKKGLARRETRHRGDAAPVRREEPLNRERNMKGCASLKCISPRVMSGIRGHTKKGRSS